MSVPHDGGRICKSKFRNRGSSLVTKGIDGRSDLIHVSMGLAGSSAGENLLPREGWFEGVNRPKVEGVHGGVWGDGSTQRQNGCIICWSGVNTAMTSEESTL